MLPPVLGRWQPHSSVAVRRARVLVVLALLSGVATVRIAGADQALVSKDGRPVGALPIVAGTADLPASVTAGQNVEARSSLPATSRISETDAGAIPPVALAAYQRAAAVLGSADRTCHLPWTLVAAIGRVESDHGRSGRSVLGPDGVERPGVFGPQLDGSGGSLRVPDTDAGRVDGDERFDRAVGPMQLVPATWSVVAVDGDGDGRRDPQDIDDAALATAVYLCSGPEDLRTTREARHAVLRYNSSEAYAAQVLSISRAYQNQPEAVGTTAAAAFETVDLPVVPAGAPQQAAPPADEQPAPADPGTAGSRGDDEPASPPPGGADEGPHQQDGHGPDHQQQPTLPLAPVVAAVTNVQATLVCRLKGLLRIGCAS